MAAWRVTASDSTISEEVPKLLGIHSGRLSIQKAGTLLARLALSPHRIFPREELIDLLWPGYDLHSGRLSLRVVLPSLRRQLEPPGIPAGQWVRHDSLGAGTTAITGLTTTNTELTWENNSNPYGLTMPYGSYALELTCLHAPCRQPVGNIRA